MDRNARLEDFPQRSFDKLRYGDTDRQGHVNNAVFATMLETGRVEMIYGSGPTIGDPGCAFVIARIELDFIGEVLWPGTVQTGTRVRSVGRSSIRMEQAVYQEGRMVAWADSILVQVSESTRRSQAFSPGVAARLAALLASPPS